MPIKIHSRSCERVGLLLVLCAVVPGASAERQKTETSRTDQRTIHESEAIGPWLVNSDQGLAIIGAALESRHMDANADCSNLVHEIYGRAGFTYAYANSTQLYRGTKEFRRVMHPQPGDLVVWRGHVGIVISPVQHSFFSAMRSGRGVEFYNSPYWQGRGRPRFFRYLKSAARNQLSASARKADVQRADSSLRPPEPDHSRTGSGVSGSPPAIGTSALENNENDSAKVSGANPPANLPVVGGQEATLHKSESQTAPDASEIDRTRPTRHKIQGGGDGVWEKTATKPSAGIPSEGQPTQRESRLPHGFGTANLAAASGHAVPKAPSESGALGHESGPEPTQWAMSRYVPRPPWASSSERASPPFVPRPRTGRVRHAVPGYGGPEWRGQYGLQRPRLE
jgi:hypothetical protein